MIIKKLSPAMADEYIRFFDETPHDDGKPENICYCVNWCGENQRGRDHDLSREERKELARKYIESGTLEGYVAIADGKIIG